VAQEVDTAKLALSEGASHGAHGGIGNLTY